MLVILWLIVIIGPVIIYIIKNMLKEKKDREWVKRDISFFPIDDFNKHLIRILTILKKYDMYLSETVIADAKALAYVVADYSAFSSNRDRERISVPILNSLTDSMTDNEKNCFSQRVHFYTSVIKGRRVHGFCMPGVNTNDESIHPITRCTIAFGDCMFNQERIANYDSEELDLYNIAESIRFAEDIFEPLVSELALLYKEIHN